MEIFEGAIGALDEYSSLRRDVRSGRQVSPARGSC